MEDLKTIVRSLREDSLSKAKDAPPLKSAAPRQKRWATKTRTGCATCRIRRIKCDETKPHCKRCSLTGRQCSGYPADAAATGATPAKRVRGVALAPRVVKHPDMDMMDAIRYFGAVMLKDETFHNVGDSAYVTTYRPALHIDRVISRGGFIAIIVTDRIVNTCNRAGVLPRHGQLPGISHLWSLLYRHIDHLIQELNAQIAGGAPIPPLLHRVVTLLSVDLSVMDPAWRAHVEGFAALVKLYGGVDQVLRHEAAENLKRTAPMALQYVLIYSTLANTTSPANDQITGLINWSVQDVAAAYAHTGFHPAPCPTAVLQDIIRITRLRTMVRAEPTVTAAFVPIARAVSDSLGHFIPEQWTEPWSKPEEPCPPLAGDLYKTSALLYAVLALPPVLAVEFCRIPGQHLGDAVTAGQRLLLLETARMAYGDRLSGLIDRAVDELPAAQGVSWPIAVLGVARRDAALEEKNKLLGYLKRLRLIPGADGGAASIELKLRDFWYFGQTTWEECYHEPINVIT